MSVELKNTSIRISDLGEKRTFVGGNENWRLDWAEYEGNIFKAGTKVGWECPDDGNYFEGLIEYIIIVDTGSVEVSTNHPFLGRLDLDELEILN